MANLPNCGGFIDARESLGGEPILRIKKELIVTDHIVFGDGTSGLENIFGSTGVDKALKTIWNGTEGASSWRLYQIATTGGSVENLNFNLSGNLDVSPVEAGESAENATQSIIRGGRGGASAGGVTGRGGDVVLEAGNGGECGGFCTGGDGGDIVIKSGATEDAPLGAGEDGNISLIGNTFILGNFTAFQRIIGNGSFLTEVCLSNGTHCQAVGGDTDTNASTECTGDEVLLGNTSCMSIASFSSPQIDNRSVFSAFDESGGQTATTSTWQEINFTEEKREDSAFTHDSDDARIEINSAGDYLLHYDICLGQTSNTRTQGSTRFALNGNVIGGTLGFTYSRLEPENVTCASAEIIENLDVGDNITMEFNNEWGGTIVVTPNATRIFMEKIGREVTAPLWATESRLNTTIVSETTYFTDPYLSFSVAQWENYTFDFKIFYAGGISNDFIFNFSRPIGEVIYGYETVSDSGYETNVQVNPFESDAIEIATGSKILDISGTFYANESGTFAPEWRTEGIGTLSIRRGSIATFRQIS